MESFPRSACYRALGGFANECQKSSTALLERLKIDELKIDDWDRMIDVYIKGVLYGIAAALPYMNPYMKEWKSGHIINVSSVYGHVVDPGATVYCATKFAVRALSEGLRWEVKPYNIRTTVISPGAVSTELLDHISEKDIQEGTKEFVSWSHSRRVVANVEWHPGELLSHPRLAE